MDRFLIALFKSFFVGVVTSDNAAEAASRATAAVQDAIGVVKTVDEALFHANGVEAWHWDVSRSSDEWLNLTVFGDLGVVAFAIGDFLDGWDGDMAENCNWHSKLGLIIVKDVPTVEWDGAVEPDWEAMGV